MVVFLIIAGFFALLAGAATWVVVKLQRIEISESKTEFDKYKIDAGKAVSIANARALEAQLALEILKTPRALTNDGAEKLRQIMSQFKGQSVSVGASPLTFETGSFAEQLNKILVAAGVEATLNQDATIFQIGVARGVVAKYTTGNKKGELLAKTFIEALKADNIAASTVDGLVETSVVNGQQPRNGPMYEWVAIAVGDKP